MPAATRRTLRNCWLATALGLGLIALPRAATAQYTLTFDSPQSSGSPIAGTYLYPGVTGTAITITDGWASNFGQTTVTSNTCGNGNHQAICANTANVFAPATGNTAQFHDGQASTGVGEFIFNPVGGRVAGVHERGRRGDCRCRCGA